MPFSEAKSRQLWDAAERGDLPLVQTLSLDPEVNLNWEIEEFKDTPFHRACFNGHVDVIRFLLDFKGRTINFQGRTLRFKGRTVDLNVREKNAGYTAFFFACSEEHFPAIEMLLRDGRIEINKPSGVNQTPLWYAAHCGHSGVVKRLLASGRQIDSQRRDTGFHQMTAAAIAREKGKDDIALLIESFERDPQQVRARLRVELWSSDAMSGELFALVVFLSDGYFVIQTDFKLRTTEWKFLSLSTQPWNEKRTNAQKFFSLALQLPMDLQMVLCKRVFGLEGSIIKGIHSEKGFKKFAKGV